LPTCRRSAILFSRSSISCIRLCVPDLGFATRLIRRRVRRLSLGYIITFRFWSSIQWQEKDVDDSFMIHIVYTSHQENRDWMEMLPWPFKSWVEGKYCHPDSNHKTYRRPFSERYTQYE
jgi:hypothetical protein